MDREKEIGDAVRACIKLLADLADFDAMYEAIDHLEAWVAMVERSTLPEEIARQ
jgi:hypothetical protein